MNETEMADYLARVARDCGWTLVEQYTREGGIVLSFTANTSIYGVHSSREKAKAKVAVRTDAFMRGYLRAVEQAEEDEHPASATREDAIGPVVTPAAVGQRGRDRVPEIIEGEAAFQDSPAPVMPVD
jgi:hypothetical protein